MSLNRSHGTNCGTAAAFLAIRRRRGPVVIIAPHPDDETLGAGRLLLALRRSGMRPAFIILTDGGGSHPKSVKWPSRRLAHLRRQELQRAVGRLGLAHPTIRHMRWRDGHLAEDGQKLRLRAMLTALSARTVLVTSPLDHHPDHKAAFALASAAVDRRTMTLWTYAVWSRVGMRPRHRHRPRSRATMLGNESPSQPNGELYRR